MTQDILQQSLRAACDSAALLRILSFEVLLKCALLLCKKKPKANHITRSCGATCTTTFRKRSSALLQIECQNKPI